MISITIFALLGNNYEHEVIFSVYLFVFVCSRDIINGNRRQTILLLQSQMKTVLRKEFNWMWNLNLFTFFISNYVSSRQKTFNKSAFINASAMKCIQMPQKSVRTKKDSLQALLLLFNVNWKFSGKINAVKNEKWMWKFSSFHCTATRNSSR